MHEPRQVRFSTLVSQTRNRTYLSYNAKFLERDLLQCQLDSYYKLPNVHIPSEYLKLLFRVVKGV